MSKVNKNMCYPVAEAFYHLLGGKKSGWKPMVGKWKGQTHWWLEHKSGFVFDPTATQFTNYPYSKGKGCGFLTKQPSKRARTIINNLKQAS